MKNAVVIFLIVINSFRIYALTDANKTKIEQMKHEKLRLEREIELKTDTLLNIQSAIAKIENEIELNSDSLPTTKSKNVDIEKNDIKETINNNFEIKVVCESFGYLKSSAVLGSATTLAGFNVNDTLTVLNYLNGYWLVRNKDGIIGYVLDYYIKSTNELVSIKNIVEKREALQREQKIKEMKELEDKSRIKKQQEEDKKKNIFKQNRPKNINNTGIWTIKEYVDRFDEKTGEKYITNKERINGKFSNTATQNSALAVEINIDFVYNKETPYNYDTKVSLFLYEYAGSNPVKSLQNYEVYNVYIKDKDGNSFSAEATNSSDRLVFNSVASELIHSLLEKGGLIKFSLNEENTPTTEYYFEIKNANNYINAYYKLLE